jgi:hypothetical protein
MLLLSSIIRCLLNELCVGMTSCFTGTNNALLDIYIYIYIYIYLSCRLILEMEHELQCLTTSCIFQITERGHANSTNN